MRLVHFSIRVTPEVKRLITEDCSAHAVSTSQLVREVLEDRYLAPSPRELQAVVEQVAQLEDLPTDVPWTTLHIPEGRLHFARHTTTGNITVYLQRKELTT